MRTARRGDVCDPASVGPPPRALAAQGGSFVPCWFAAEHGSPELRPFPHLNGLGCSRFGQANANSALAPHRHDGIELHYIHAGRYRWTVEGRSYVAKAGDAFITCPWHLHGSGEGVRERGSYAWAIIAPERFPGPGRLRLGAWSWLTPALERELGALLPRAHLLPRAAVIGDLLGAIAREVSAPGLGGVERANVLLADLLLNAARLIDRPDVDRGRDVGTAQGLEERVKAAIDRPWQLADLCHEAGLAPAHLRRVLRAETGLTPRGFVQQARTDLAIARMLSGWPLARTALACGFASQQHFTTAFRKATGLSPAAWLAQHAT